ncbi:MAG: DUF58 domain-containing protein [Fimbriimonadaceae bacterium]|nr:DUF58 domain-containing protein [Fimbriimonadaceae bacterium]
MRGERLSRKKGVSIEFADYREYAEGDDLRHFDWNVYARLENAVVRTYQDEEDLAVHLLLDRSASMSFGDPSKAQAARRFAAAFGHVALGAGDALFLVSLGTREAPAPPIRGRATYPKLVRRLSSDPPEGREGLARSLRAFAAGDARPGLAILLSDGLDPDIEAGVRALASRGHEVLFLQILSAVDLEPDLEGDLRLLDSETDGTVEITANSYALRGYQANLRAHQARIAEAVRRCGGRIATVRSEASVEDFLRTTGRREAWVVR